MTLATVRATRLAEGVRCALTICSPTSSRLQGSTGLARITDKLSPARSPESGADRLLPRSAPPPYARGRRRQIQAYDSWLPLALNIQGEFWLSRLRPGSPAKRRGGSLD